MAHCLRPISRPPHKSFRFTQFHFIYSNPVIARDFLAGNLHHGKLDISIQEVMPYRVPSSFSSKTTITDDLLGRQQLRSAGFPRTVGNNKSPRFTWRQAVPKSLHSDPFPVAEPFPTENATFPNAEIGLPFQVVLPNVEPFLPRGLAQIKLCTLISSVSDDIPNMRPLHNSGNGNPFAKVLPTLRANSKPRANIAFSQHPLHRTGLSFNEG